MTEKIKIALLDFDGTLVTEDILDVLCGIVGKRAESKKLNEAFHRGESLGRSSLISRINFLTGITKSQITKVLKHNNYLMPGTKELMQFFKDKEIVTILASGNILPVLEYYQQLLGIDYIVGSKPDMDGETIIGITESAFSSKSLKTDGIKTILSNYEVTKANIIALGDSPGDKSMFEMSGYAIAINPKGNIADFADTVIEDDLSKVIIFLEGLI